MAEKDSTNDEAVGYEVTEELEKTTNETIMKRKKIYHSNKVETKE